MFNQLTNLIIIIIFPIQLHFFHTQSHILAHSHFLSSTTTAYHIIKSHYFQLYNSPKFLFLHRPIILNSNYDYYLQKKTEYPLKY
jgi:hypothetical protein